MGQAGADAPRRPAAPRAGWVLVGLLTLAQGCGPPADEPPPNILVILTDQLTTGVLDAAGDTHMDTPAIDTLAAQGTLFTRSYCTSPECSPARSSLVTGLLPHQTGVTGNGDGIPASIPNLGEVLQGAGYHTAWVGKWHLPRAFPEDHDAIPGFQNLRLDLRGDRLGAELDDAIARRAADFLVRPRKDPFALVVSFLNPHDICLRLRDGDLDEPASGLPPLPDNFAPDPLEPEVLTRFRELLARGREDDVRRAMAERLDRPRGLAERAGIDPAEWPAERWRQYVHTYHRLVEQVDGAVAQVLAALDQAGLRERTLVVFTSDHGDGLTAHQWLLKGCLYEESVQVPLIVSWPGRVPEGRVDREQLVSGTDLLPTLCDWAGVPEPPPTAGLSLKDLLLDDAPLDREAVVVELDRDLPDGRVVAGRMLRTARYKYVVHSEGARPEQFFDLEVDPGEQHDLSGDPAHAAALDEHRARLDAWLAATDDPFVRPAVEGEG